MGQAFDREGNVLGEAFGDTTREVFDKLTEQFKDAHEIRIRNLEDAAIRGDVRRCTCVPVTAAGVMVPDPHCPAHGTPKVTFNVATDAPASKG